MTLEMWTLAIALVTACACALAGVFLVVKREALVCEGLSHAVLPGIIVAYILLRDRSSPLLIVGAAAMGLLMVILVQAIQRTGLVDADASLGIVFAAMFSIGIVLANQELKNTHFHAHCIIDGNLALAPLDTWEVGGVELGPKAFYAMSAVLLLIIGFMTVFYKELKLMLFDPGLANSLGLKPTLLHFCWLALVSLTTVTAFETAGSILVVALMITPPAAAYLLTNRLSTMLILSCLIGSIAAVAGFYSGLALDIAPTGPMASITGALFLLALFFAPVRGLFSRWNRRRRRRAELHEHMLLLELSGHTSGIMQSELHSFFAWPAIQVERIVRSAIQSEFIGVDGNVVSLTQQGAARLQAYEKQI